MYCNLSESQYGEDPEEELPFEELTEEEKVAKCHRKLEGEKLRRQIEFLNFIEELALSDEFVEYLNRLHNKVDTEVQCDGVSQHHDARVEEEYVKKQKVAVKKRDVHLKDIIKKKQEDTINKIREIIYNQGEQYRCYVRIKEEKILKERQEIFSKLKTDYGIELVYHDHKSKVVDKVMSIRKKARFNTLAQNQRKFQIIKKILDECKRDFQIQKQKNKKYDYKIVSSRDTVVIFATRTGGYESIDTRLTYKQLEYLHAISALSITPKGSMYSHLDKSNYSLQNLNKKISVKDLKRANKLNKAKNKKKAKKAAKISVKTKSKSMKKDKKSKGKKSKGKKSLKNQMISLEMPHIPCINPRKTVIPDKVTCEAIISGINYVKSLDKIIEDFEKEKENREDRLFDEDKEFASTPNEITIRNFQNGKRYRVQLEITNTAMKLKKCRFIRVYYVTEEDDADIIQVTSPGILLLAPGISAKILVAFRPLISMETVQAKLIFMTYDSHANNFGQLTVNITCCIQEANVIYTPKTVKFEPVSIWHVERSKIIQTITFKNTGEDIGRIIIRKVANDATDEDITSMISAYSANSIIHQIEENVFSNFNMQSYCFDINPAEEIKFKIQFKTAGHIGFYIESYLVYIYKMTPKEEIVLNSIQDLFLTASTTGYSTSVEPTNLDFEICVYSSIYQQSFILENLTKKPLRSVLKFPNCLKDFFIYQKSEILIQGFEKQLVHLKFLPRENLLQDYCEYFDKETGLLEFPLKIETVVYDSIKQPPLQVVIYAILMQPLGVFLRPKDNFVLETTFNKIHNRDDARCAITLGDCSTKEFISTQLEVVNNSNCLQHFGFLKLPEHFILSPNYGFGVLQPFKSKTLRLYFVPDRKHNFDVREKLIVNTIKNLGKMRKTVNSVKINKRLKQLEHSLKLNYNEKLMMSIMSQCIQMIRENSDFMKLDGEEFVDNADSIRTDIDNTIDTVEVLMSITNYDEQENEEEDKELKLETIKNLVEDEKLALIGNIRDILLDFSAQYVRFKDTPCGTISTALLFLHAYPTYMDLDPCVQQRSKKYHYLASFEITGDNPEIMVEPTCGILKVGEKARIYLLAKPEVPDDVVITKAKNKKIQELTRLKRAEIKLQMEKERLAKLAKEVKKKMPKLAKKKTNKNKKGKSKKDKKSKGKKDKKSKKGKSSETSVDIISPKEKFPEAIKDEDIIVEIKDEEISLSYFDYYPAEMCLWRKLNPYVIEGNFVCTIHYLENKELQGKEDILQFKAVCKVVKPEITHNLTTQYLDFGHAVIGTRVTKLIDIQNITYGPIIVRLSKTNPHGPYRLPDFTNLLVRAEYIARLPLVFNPLIVDEFLEYMEITTSNTRIPIILKGIGVVPDITFVPLFTIVRLDCPKDQFTESPIEISNNTAADVLLRFEKVCELTGYIRSQVTEVPKSPFKKDSKKKGSSKSSKSSKKSKKLKKQKRPKLSKYSEFLTDLEQSSLVDYFEKQVSSNFFNIATGSSEKPNTVSIPANSKAVVQIQFGQFSEEKPQVNKFVEVGNSYNKQEKAGKSKKNKGNGKRNKSSSKKSKSSSKKGKSRSKKSKSSSKADISSKKSKEKLDKSSKVSEKTLKKEMMKTCAAPEPDTLCYVCKYNVLLDSVTFFKDIIIIGYFN